MDLNTVFTKTSKGAMEVSGKSRALSREQSRVLSLVDGKSNVGEILDKAGRMSQRKLEQVLSGLASAGFVRILNVSTGETVLADEFGFSSTILVDEANTEAFFEAQAELERRARVESERAEKEKEVDREALLAELKAEKEALERAKKEKADAAAKAETERKEKEAAEAREKAKVAEEARRKADAERKARLEAELKAKAEAERKAREEAERKAAAEARARAEAEAKAREEAATKACLEAEAKEAARKAAEAKARAEAEARERAAMAARMQEAEAARRKAEEERQALARQLEEAKLAAELDARVKRRLEARAREEEEARRRSEAEAQAKLEAEARRREEAEAKAREEAEARRRAEEEAKAKAEAERKAREEAEARVAAERRAREEAERRVREEAEAKARAEAEARRRAEEEAKAKAEVERKAREEAEARAEAERRAREEAEKREREEAEARERAEADARRRAEEEAKAEAERKAREEAEARARAEAQAKEEAERKAREEAEAKARAEEEARQRAELEAKAAAERKAREEAEERAWAEEEAKLQAQLREREAAEQAEALKRAEAERKALELAEQRALAEAAAFAREEERAAAKAEAERKAREEAEEARRRAEEQERFLLEEEERERAEADARAQALAQAKTDEQAALERILGSKRPALQIDFGKWAKYGALGAAGGLALAFLLAHLISFNFYAPQLEAQLTKTLGEPVQISALRFSAFPAPHWRMEQVVVGKLHDVKVAKAELQPALGDWFGDIKHVKLLSLDGVSLDADTLPRVAEWLGRQAQAGFRFERIDLNQVKLGLPGVEVPAFGGRVDVANGTFGKAVLITVDRRATLEVQPMAGGFQMHLLAQRWTPPIGVNLEFQSLDIQGLARGHALDIDSLFGELHGGSVKGSGRVTWEDGWKATLDADIKRVNLASAMPVFTGDIRTEGSLDAKVHIALQSDKLERLSATPEVRATFVANEGSIGNVDLVRAINAPARSSVSGGQTKFNVFSGYLQLAKGKYQYRQLRLTLGMLSATGAVEIDADKTISGTAASELRSKTTAIRVPLTVSGTLATPTLRGGVGAAPAKPGLPVPAPYDEG